MCATPTYIYKLIPSSQPHLISFPLPEKLPCSSLDTTSGFIHLSTAKQLPGTLGRYFADETLVYVLRLEYAHVKKDIRWEDPKGETPGEMGTDGIYPHLYNDGQLGRQEVEKIFKLEKTESNDWDTERIQELDWLIN